MLKQVVTLAVLLSCSLAAWADYPADRKAAADLMNAGKNEEALAAFLKLADAATSDAQKGDALQQAALIAGRMRKYDQAMEIAKKITQTELSKSTRMQVMLWNAKHEELVAAFKDEDMSTWPEKIAGPAYFSRGRAYMTLRNGKAAEADLKKAVELGGEGDPRNEARLLLADTYRDLLQDDASALAAYKENIAQAPRFGWINMMSVTSAAGVLANQKKFDDALAMLNTYDIKGMNGVWKYNFVLAHADLEVAQGKKAEATVRLKEALTAKDLPDWQKAAFEARLKTVQPDAK